MSLQYNTQKEKLILPEYGRNIQQMVDYCVTIPDREERTRCAYTIIQIMGNLFPQIRDSDDYKHKLWDHLAIMSDFKLDIDFPYEVVKKENLESKPQKVEYKLSLQVPRRGREECACVTHRQPHEETYILDKQGWRGGRKDT